MRAALAILLMVASVLAANAFGLGREGLGFGKLGVASKSGSGGAPPSGCASTGIYDLSNVCNDVYFIGALK